MKQRISLQFIFLLFIIGGIYGQNTCLSGVHFIRNQEDINAILENYPDCEIIEGSVFIWGNGTGEHITNLNSFSQIKEIQGFLQLRNNPLINDLSGLSNLEVIGDILYIQGNDSLTDLVGLNNVKDIDGNVFIGQNEVLETLSGLEGLESINGNINIRNNAILNNITSLNSISTINGYINIQENNNLLSLNGLENIDPYSIKSSDAAFKDLNIKDNPQLEICDIESICSFLDINSSSVVITNNADGCNTSTEILEQCNISETCLTNGVRIEYQHQLDNFTQNYPGCTTILGNVIIEGSTDQSIKDLNGLSNIKTIGGKLHILENNALMDLDGLNQLDSIGFNLFIRGNDGLNDLTGLNNLEYVYEPVSIYSNESLSNLQGLTGLNVLNGLTIYDNTNLISLNGLENLDTIYGNLDISNNKNLTNINSLSSLKVTKPIGTSSGNLVIENNYKLLSLEGLDNLESLTGSLIINGNDKLHNLDPLSKLKSVGSRVEIRYNDELVSINGIGNIDPNSIESNSSVYEDLIIYKNPELSMCNVQSVCDILEIENKSVKIEQNGDGCLNKEEVIASCTSSSKEFNTGNVSIVPNPCYSNIIISAEKQINHISFFNVYGQKVKELNNGNQTRLLNIDVSDLNSGLYFLVFSVNSSKEWKKIVKK